MRLPCLTCAISLTKGRRKIIIGIIEPIREQESGKDYAMRWLDKMERRFGRYAIPNLMYYIIILYALGFVVQVVSPELYYQYLALDAAAILRGEVWRIFTFIIQPPTGSFIFIFFSLYLYYMIGKMLEYQWGAFRFNMYFFSGLILHVLVCLAIYLVTGYNMSYGTMYLNMSLFFAFAALFPDVQFLLFFIIPIKCKYLGYANGLYFIITIVAGFIVPIGTPTWRSLIEFGILATPANSVAALVSFLNFIIFFLAMRRSRFSPKDLKRRRTYGKKVKAAAARSSRHRCAVCGRTEKDGEELEFRFCSKCAGNYEYCQDHLFTHEHRK